jgi:penicillin-binding protein 1A
MVISWRERIARVPWIAVGLGLLAVLVLIAVVPPFRRTVANVSSRAILFAASPFAPSTSGFDDLTRASRVLASDGTEVGLLGTELREPVRLSHLPPHVPRAVLAAEDAHFYHHSGVDPSAVFRAMFNTVAGRPQGGSTITQQLAKLNYTGSKRTLLRKFKEVLYASRLEQRHSKEELLERYLNQVYFGEGAYGIGAASQAFFGVEPHELTPGQAATLAGKIRAPSALDPYSRPDEVRERRGQVLRAMGRHGWLSGEDVDKASASPLDVTERKPASAGASGRAPHFVRYVGREGSELDELGPSADVRRNQLFTGGYTIETTLDPEAHDAGVEATRQFLGQEGDPTTAIVSVQPADGAIRVLFGGLDDTMEFDPASQGRRQPGSSFKPFVYLAMLKAGIDPRSSYDAGSPKTVDCRGTSWTVNNYEGKGSGAVTADVALAQSINTVYAQIMAQVGPSAVADAAKKAGIADEEVTPPECAMALGGLRQGVSPLEQAAAFATFAAKGVYAEPYAITRILDRDGAVVFERNGPKTTQAFSSREAGVLTSALEAVVQNGTGTAAAVGRPMAGKTGTTENYGNAWFIGYVPQLSTAVWVGYPQGDVPMTNVRGVSVTGGSLPARIFSGYMREALADVPVQELYRASASELALRGAPKPAPLAADRSAPTTSAVPTPSARRPVITLAPRPTTTLRAPVPTTPRPTLPPTSSPTTSPPSTTPTTAVPSPTTTTTAKIT